jgi:4-methyl-5(b-hydroxyethyl)-thiazole monophosphate biosynthesis
MKDKIYIFLADGFEEIEVVTVVDMLRRAGHEVVMVSVTSNEVIRGAHGISLFCDRDFTDCDFFDDPGILVLPGGMPGAATLRDHVGLQKVLTKYAAQNRLITAICAAPMALGALGLLENHKATCYPGIEKYLKGATLEKKLVVADGNFITGMGPGAAVDFVLAIIEKLDGAEAAKELCQSMCIQK